MGMWSDVIACFGTTITRKRFDGGEYIDGEWVEGVPTLTENIVASVQPASGDETEPYSEGYRRGSIYKFYTEEDFRTSSKNNQVIADHVIYNGRTWEVMDVGVHYWPDGNVYKVIMRVFD